MKKKLRLFLPLALILSLTSCNEEEEISSFDNSVTIEAFQNSSLAKQKEIFEKDSRVLEFLSLGNTFKKLNSERSNDNKMLATHIKMQKVANSIYSKYGRVNVEKILNETRTNNVSETVVYFDESGDKCKRNSNGTVDYKACEGFWENLVVYFGVAGCPNNSTEELYNCAQAVVCESC